MARRVVTGMLLKRCQTTGMNLKLQCKQLSLEKALTLGWPLVIRITLLPQAEVLVMAEAAVEAAVEAEVSDLSAKS